MTGQQAIIATAALLSTGALAADPAALMTAKTYTSSEGLELPYRIYVPATVAANEKIPTVLFFHGAGERGRHEDRRAAVPDPEKDRHLPI